MAAQERPAGEAGHEIHRPESGEKGRPLDPESIAKATGAYRSPQVHSYSSKQLLSALGTAQG